MPVFGARSLPEGTPSQDREYPKQDRGTPRQDRGTLPWQDRGNTPLPPNRRVSAVMPQVVSLLRSRRRTFLFYGLITLAYSGTGTRTSTGTGTGTIGNNGSWSLCNVKRSSLYHTTYFFRSQFRCPEDRQCECTINV